MTKGQWKFDGSVAETFYEHAKKHIPDYEKVIELCVDVARRRLPSDAKILDVGSAVWHTLKRMRDVGFSNVFGVETSEDMISKSFPDATIIRSSAFPSEYAPFDMVMANWTLHFILEGRDQYLRDIYAGLKPWGCFILSDKMLPSDFTVSMYHDFKRRSGVSDEEIRQKDEAIRWVLVPYPVEWYLENLRSAGFRSIEIINAAPAFVTFFAIK